MQTLCDRIDAAADTGMPVSVSYPPEAGEGWLELLAKGLTFEIHGLAPAKAKHAVESRQAYGFGPDGVPRGLEAVQIVPSPHISAGAGLQPVLRTLLSLAANLCMHLPTRGVGWGPAQTIMESRYFTSVTLNWLAGGPFPAAGLTALTCASDGSVTTRGLAHFTGQEMQLEGRQGESEAQATRMAVHAIDHLVREGTLAQAITFGTGEGTFIAEPSQVGKLVLVWRKN